jgi:endonuclease/exonuclease/phosphatase family metal-dependent hydrolase
MGRPRQQTCHVLAVVVGAVCHLLTGCAAVTNYPDPLGPAISGKAGKSPEYRGEELVVVTYNIELGEKIDLAIEEIEEDSILRSADIFLLQEMDPSGVERLASHFDLDYIYYPSAVHSKHGKDYGNAILSRWPLKEPKKIVLPHEDPLRKQIRIATAATVVVGEREIRAMSTHTEMYRLATRDRVEQIDSITRAIDRGQPYVVVGGDFNTVRGHVLKRFDREFEEIGMQRATEGVGWTADADPMGILHMELDHIYTRGFLVTGSGKMSETESSDHHPVWVSLRFAEGL